MPKDSVWAWLGDDKTNALQAQMYTHPAQACLQLCMVKVTQGSITRRGNQWTK